MTYYDIWCDIRDTTKDLEFCGNVSTYLGALEERGLIAGFSITRRTLGLGPENLGDFHITIEVEGLAQLERVFDVVAARGPEIEPMHKAVYSHIRSIKFGLRRDFPDSVRVKNS